MGRLEKYKNIFFKLNAVLLVVISIVAIWSIYDLAGVPNSNIMDWNARQWDLIYFLWVPMGINILFQVTMAFMCVKKIYLTFPLVASWFFLSFLGTAIWNVNQLLTKGLIYPSSNIGGVLVCLEFILAVIGTIFWVGEISRGGKGWWFR